MKDNFDAVKFLNVFNKAQELGYFSSISAELFIKFILQDFRDETIVFNKLNGKDSQFFFPFLILLEECELLCIKTLSKINSNGFLRTSGGGIKRTNDMATKVRDCVKKHNLASSASFKLLADFIIDEFELQNRFSSESVLNKLIRFT